MLKDKGKHWLTLLSDPKRRKYIPSDSRTVINFLNINRLFAELGEIKSKGLLLV